MAALQSILPALVLASQAVDMVVSPLVQDRRAAAEADARDAASRAAAEDVEARRQEAERERRERLRRALAHTRARLAGQGVASGTGSGAALLAGVARESAAGGAAEDAAFGRRLADIERDRAHASRMSLLDRQENDRRRRLADLRAFADKAQTWT